MIPFTDLKKLFEHVTPGTFSPQVSAGPPAACGSISFPVAINPISRKYETKSQSRPQSAFHVPQAMRTSPGQQLFRRAPAPMKTEQRFSPSIMFLNQAPQHSTPTSNPLIMQPPMPGCTTYVASPLDFKSPHDYFWKPDPL